VPHSRKPVGPTPTLEHRVALFRSVTLLHGLAEEMLLLEPGEAALAGLEAELLARARQLVAILERRYPPAAESDPGVIDLARRMSLRAVLAALGTDTPGPRSPPRRAA